MKRRLILGITGAMLAVVAFSGSAFAAGPVFENGSFESGNFVPLTPPIDFARLSTNATNITGWTVTAGSVDWIGTYWQAAAGSKSLDLDGDEGTPGAISQTFETKIGSTYVVTFAMSGNPDAGPVEKTMTVAAAGATQTDTYNTTGNTVASMNWVTKTFTFVATGLTTTLTFTSTTPGGFGPALDNVVITETVKPGADCKKGGWQTMVDSAGTSFRNQGDCVSFYATGEKNLAF